MMKPSPKKKTDRRLTLFDDLAWGLSFVEVAERVGPVERDGVFGTQTRKLNTLTVKVAFRFAKVRLERVTLRGVRTYKKTRDAAGDERKLLAWIAERASPWTSSTEGRNARCFIWELPSVTIRTYCDLSLHAWFDIPKRR